MSKNKFKRQYSSSTHMHIRAEMCGITIGKVQTVGYQVPREKAPISTMGNPDPRNYARGKRAISGPLCMSYLDKDNLEEALEATEHSKDLGIARMLDLGHLPPFDIILTSVNEHGSMCAMAIKGIELINKGYGITPSEFIERNTFHYVAREWVPWSTEPVVKEDISPKEQPKSDFTRGYNAFKDVKIDPDDIIKKGSFLDNKYQMTRLESKLYGELEDAAGIKCTEVLEEDHTGQIYNPYTDTWSWM